MFHFTLQETLKKELHNAHAVTRSLKKDIELLNKETRTSDEDAAILEKKRCAYGQNSHCNLLQISIIECNFFMQAHQKRGKTL
jgi:hypothetical protein